MTSKDNYFSSADTLVIPATVRLPDNTELSLAGQKLYCEVSYGLSSSRWCRVYKFLPILDFLDHSIDNTTPREKRTYRTKSVVIQPTATGAMTSQESHSDNPYLAPQQVIVEKGGSYATTAANSRTLSDVLNDSYVQAGIMEMIDAGSTNPATGFPSNPAEYYMKQQECIDQSANDETYHIYCIQAKGYQWQRFNYDTREWEDIPLSENAGAQSRSITLDNITYKQTVRCLTTSYTTRISGGRIMDGGIEEYKIPPRRYGFRPIDDPATNWQPVFLPSAIIKIIPVEGHYLGGDLLNPYDHNLGDLERDHYSYDPDTKTLTLQNYRGGADRAALGSLVNGSGAANVNNDKRVISMLRFEDDLTLRLEGKNELDFDKTGMNFLANAYYAGSSISSVTFNAIRAKNLTVTGDGSLSVNMNFGQWAADLHAYISYIDADSVCVEGNPSLSFYLNTYAISDTQLDSDYGFHANTLALDGGRITMCHEYKNRYEPFVFFKGKSIDSAFTANLENGTYGLELRVGASQNTAVLQPISSDETLTRLSTVKDGMADEDKYQQVSLSKVHIHDWEAPTVIKPATLTEGGQTRTQCKTCPVYTVTDTPVFTVTSPAANAAGDNMIEICWNEHPEAARYDVYRSETADAGFVKVGSVVKAGDTVPASYSDTGLTLGKTYYYRVQGAKADNALLTPMSAVVSATVRKTPAVPKNVKAAATAEKTVTVTWTPSVGATSHKIYRLDPATGSFEPIASVSGSASSYADTGLTVDTTYTYRVEALSDSLSYGPSDPVSAKARARLDLSIAVQPNDLNVNAGADAAFAVEAQGDGLTYAWWYKDPGKTAFSKSAATGSSFTFTASSALNGREVYCVVTDQYGNSKQTVTVKLGVLTPLQAKDVTLSFETVTYDRTQKTPSVTVKNAAGKTLTKNTDYTVTLPAGRTNPGTYTYVIKGKGIYSGTVKKSFTIVEVLKKERITLSADRFTYDGTVKTPSVTVKNAAGKTLTKNTDYTVTLPAGRTKPGTYTYVITGKGNYAGAVEKIFTINAAS